MTHIVAGQKVRRADLSIGEMIARASRATSSTAASAAQGVLRLDGVALTAGRRYVIRPSSLLLTSSVAADRGTARLAMDTTGAAATTGSTLYALNNSPPVTVSDGVECTPWYSYTPSVNETVSIILFTQRLAGTGNIRLLVSGSSTIDIEVFDCGVDPGDTGVDL